MPIIDHDSIPETPWRPNYHKWDITRPGDGTTSSSMSYSVVGVGAGAPLHTHEADELIMILEGTLEARLGDDVQNVGAKPYAGHSAQRATCLQKRRPRRCANHNLLSRTRPVQPHDVPQRRAARVAWGLGMQPRCANNAIPICN